MHESWKPYNGCIAPIEVSNLGRVRTLNRITDSKNGIPQQRKGNILSPWIDEKGYMRISIKNGDRRCKYYIHRLVALTYVKGDFSLTINHIDGNKLNNLPKNLEWITLADNSKHQWNIGLVKRLGSILTISDVQRIRTQKEEVSFLAKELGVSQSLIYKIRQRKRWK